MRSLTWPQVLARRLERSHLLELAPPERLIEVVRDVGGIHAQVTSAAELSLSARVDGVTRRDVRRELWERRGLVKVWSLRGTLHLHPAEELPLWMAARRAVAGSRDGWFQGYLDPPGGEAVLAAIRDALDGRCLLREELADEVARRVGAQAREGMLSGWGQLLEPATRIGMLCHGPPRGTKVTFVRADQWIGGWPEIDPHEALTEVARRYLATYGPATHREFAQWFTTRHFRPADARRLLENMGDELEEVDVEGRRAWLLGTDSDVPDGGADSVRLLPQYDCYIMGFRERDHLLPEAAREALVDHSRGRLEGPAAVPWLLVDGFVAGIWERSRRGQRVELGVRPFVPLTGRQRDELEAQAARMGRFLDAEVALVVAPP
jgi:Winged helix DNA-binding domain